MIKVVHLTQYQIYALELIKAQAGEHHGCPEAEKDVERITSLLEDELSLNAAETGADRESNYDAEQHFSDVLDEAHLSTEQLYCY
jgi:hypothetical protein